MTTCSQFKSIEEFNCYIFNFKTENPIHIGTVHGTFTVAFTVTFTVGTFTLVQTPVHSVTRSSAVSRSASYVTVLAMTDVTERKCNAKVYKVK